MIPEVKKGDIIKFTDDGKVKVCGRVQFVVHKNVYVDIGKVGFVDPFSKRVIQGWIQLGSDRCPPTALYKTELGYECYIRQAILSYELTQLDKSDTEVKKC